MPACSQKIRIGTYLQQSGEVLLPGQLDGRHGAVGVGPEPEVGLGAPHKLAHAPGCEVRVMLIVSFFVKFSNRFSR